MRSTRAPKFFSYKLLASAPSSATTWSRERLWTTTSRPALTRGRRSASASASAGTPRRYDAFSRAVRDESEAVVVPVTESESWPRWRMVAIVRNSDSCSADEKPTVSRARCGRERGGASSQPVQGGSGSQGEGGRGRRTTSADHSARSSMPSTSCLECARYSKAAAPWSRASSASKSLSARGCVHGPAANESATRLLRGRTQCERDRRERETHRAVLGRRRGATRRRRGSRARPCCARRRGSSRGGTSRWRRPRWLLRA